MICVPLSDMDFEECLSLAGKEPFVEFRFDLLDLEPEQVSRVVKAASRSIATFRPGTGEEGRRLATLVGAMEAGADYVDVELDAGTSYRRELIRKARSLGTEVVVSHHDFKGTPRFEDLKSIAASCRKAGADVVKIACMVRDAEDIRSLMGLYLEKGRKVVIGMGEKGLITRIAAPFLGAEFTFASLSEGRETAPGQVDRKRLASLIRGIHSSFINS